MNIHYKVVKSFIVLIFILLMFGCKNRKINMISQFEDEESSSSNEFIMFTINEIEAQFSENDITLTLQWGTELSSLSAKFSHTGSFVTVNGIKQVSGITFNDFTNPIEYKIFGDDGEIETYTVIVKKQEYHPNLVSLWKLNDLTDGIAFDNIGFNDGSIYGDIETELVDDEELLVFSGNNYIEIDDHEKFRNVSSFSISLALYASDFSSFKYIINKWWYRDQKHQGEASRSWALNLEGEDLIWRGSNNGNDSGEVRISYPYSVHLEEWVHVVATYDGFELALYINGELFESAALLDLITTNRPLLIGAGNHGEWWYFNGILKDVSFFDKALSSSEVDQLYQGDYSSYNNNEIIENKEEVEDEVEEEEQEKEEKEEKEQKEKREKKKK